jgi:Fe2+ transport system protein FeoA
MYLDKCKISDILEVEKIDGDDDFKQRLYSFGINVGSTLKVVNITLAKQTIQIENEDGTLIALRFSEAKFIKVKK